MKNKCKFHGLQMQHLINSWWKGLTLCMELARFSTCAALHFTETCGSFYHHQWWRRGLGAQAPMRYVPPRSTLTLLKFKGEKSKPISYLKPRVKEMSKLSRRLNEKFSDYASGNSLSMSVLNHLDLGGINFLPRPTPPHMPMILSSRENIHIRSYHHPLCWELFWIPLPVALCIFLGSVGWW